MKFLRIIPLILVVPFFFVCVDNFNNPTDSQYDGDYRYTIYWDSLTIHDTLEIFRPYTVPFAVTGADTFSSFTVVDSSGIIIVDQNFLNDHRTDTSVVFYFIRSYAGRLTFTGIRPNGKESDSICPGELLIINPFQLDIDSLWGIGDQATGNVVKTFNSLYADSSLLAIWSVGDSVIDTLSWYLPFSKTFTSSADYPVIVTLRDTLGNVISLSPVSISITGNSPVIDSAWFAVPPCLGDTATFMVKVTDADSDSLSFNAYVNDTSMLITSPLFYPYAGSMSVLCQAPVRDTGVAVFTIQAFDKSGLSSLLYQFTDTISYKLPQPVFSDTVKTVPLGKPVVLSFDDANNRFGTEYRWFSRRLPVDTVTYSDSLSVFYTDTLTDTVSVYGTDAFGFSGDTASLIIIPRYFNYTLDKAAWPENLQARRWNVFSVEISPQTAAVYFWSVTPEDLVDTVAPDSNTLRLYVHDSIPQVTISVFAVENGGDTTNVVSGLTPTVLNRPVCLFTEENYDAKAGETVICSLAVSDVNGSVTSVYLRFGGGDTLALVTETSFDTVFSVPCSRTVYCWAMDDDGFYSVIDSAAVVITSDKPYFDPITADTTVFVNDSVELSVTAYPGNTGAVINAYFWDIDGSGTWDDTTDMNFITVRFTSVGNETVYAGCINSFGDTEVQRFAWHVTVDPGTPQISSVSVKEDSVYINDTIQFMIHAYDNGSVIKYEYSLDSTAFTDIGGDSVFFLSFADSGKQYVYTRVTDDESNKSDVYRRSVYIRYGAPYVDSISHDTVWVNDENSYTFHFHDVNDSVESITVNFGDGSVDSTVSDPAGTSASIAHTYPVTKDTGYTINASVTDNDGITISKDFTIWVLEGKPAIDSVWIDTTGDNLFVVDSRKYHVKASDENGYIKSVYVSWDGDNSAEDSISISSNNSEIDSFFVYSFSTGESGDRTIRFWVRDDDILNSQNRDTSVTVRLGAPALRGDTDDTTWVIVDKQPGQNFTLHINSFDTNGVFTRFYWQETSPFDTTSGSCVKTDDSTRTRSISQAEMHYALKSWIYGKDDDGLLGGKQFIVYADSVPVKPTIVEVPEGDSIKIMWSGKDFKDGDATQYRIILKQGAPPDSADILVDFKPGTEYLPGDSGYERKYGYKAGTSGLTYYYKVISRDARGSMIYSDNGTFIFP